MHTDASRGPGRVYQSGRRSPSRGTLRVERVIEPPILGLVRRRKSGLGLTMLAMNPFRCDECADGVNIPAKRSRQPTPSAASGAFDDLFSAVSGARWVHRGFRRR